MKIHSHDVIFPLLPIAVAKIGDGTVVLTNSNTYAGKTTISAGTLALGANDVLPATAVTIGNATLDAATFTDTVGTLDVTTLTSKINLGAGAALAFADGDGFTNLHEFLFGTSPIAGNGSLVAVAASSGNLVLRWLQRESGATYTLKQSAILTGGSWTTALQIPALDGNQAGAPTDYDYHVVTLPTSGGKLFYRIEGVEN